MTKIILKAKSSSPSFAEILKKVDERNKTAAVDVYGRILLGLIGFAGAVVVFVFADQNDKFLGLVFLFIPTMPVIWGVSDDITDAKLNLLKECSEVKK